jgi:hypothetical protein
VSLEVSVGATLRPVPENGARRRLELGEEVSVSVTDGSASRWLGGASLAEEGRLEWDAESETHRLRGPARDIDLAAYLAGLVGDQVKVYVADGRGQRWVLIEGQCAGGGPNGG